MTNTGENNYIVIVEDYESASMSYLCQQKLTGHGKPVYPVSSQSSLAAVFVGKDAAVEAADIHRKNHDQSANIVILGAELLGQDFSGFVRRSSGVRYPGAAARSF